MIYQRGSRHRLPAMLLCAGLVTAAVSRPWTMCYGDEILEEDGVLPDMMELPAQEDAPAAIMEDGADAPREEARTQNEEESLLIEDEGAVSVGAEFDLDQIRQAEEEAAASAARMQLVEDMEVVLPAPDTAVIREYLQGLTRSPGPAGSDEELLTARYIEEEMEKLGYRVTEHSFHEGFLNSEMKDVPGLNVIAERGADAETSGTDIIVVASHYDVRTWTGEDAADSASGYEMSGAAAALETARLLAQIESRADVCFVFLSGEEDGGYGALRFAESLEDELKSRIRGVIYLDQVAARGDAQPQMLLGCADALGNAPAQRIRSAAGKVMERAGLPDIDDTDETETDPQPAAETAPPAFSFVKDPDLSRTYLENNGLTAVRVFRDTAGRYILDENGMITDIWEGIPDPDPSWKRSADGDIVYPALTESTDDEQLPEDPFPDTYVSMIAQAAEITGEAVLTYMV